MNEDANPLAPDIAAFLGLTPGDASLLPPILLPVISQHVRDHIAAHITQDARLSASQAELAEIKAKFTQESVQEERNLHRLERQLSQRTLKVQELQAELDALKSSSGSSSTRVRELELALDAASSSLTTANARILQLQSEFAAKDRAAQDALQIAAQHKKEADRLSDLARTLEAQVCASAKDSGELRSRNLQLEADVHDKNQQIADLQHQLTDLSAAKLKVDADIERLSTDAHLHRQSHTASTAHLETELRQARELLAASEERLTLLRARVTAQREAREAEIDEIVRKDAERLEVEEGLRVELLQQKNLASLYEAGMQEAREKLESAKAEEVQRMTKANTSQEELKDKLKQKEAVILELEDRLAHQDATVDQLRRDVIAGAANATSEDPSLSLSDSGALTSSRMSAGKSFTQVYTEFTETRLQLRQVTQEKAAIQAELDAFYAQVMEQTPRVEADRRELSLLRDAESAQARQLEEARRRQLDAEARLLSASTLLTQRSRERDALAKELAAMGLQLRHLLMREYERAAEDPSAPAIPIPQPIDENPSASDLTEEEMVIRDHLTVFDGVEGLLEQNRRLLRVTREMAARSAESTELAREEARESGAAQLLQAREIVEALQAEVRRQEARAESYRRERDMIREIHSDAPPRVVPDHDDPENPSHLPTSSTDADVRTELAELQANFDTYRQEAGVDLHISQEQLRASEVNLSKSRIKLGEAQSRLQFEQERLANAIAAKDEVRGEADDLRVSLATQQAILARFELTAERGRADLEEAKAALGAANGQLLHLRAERDVIHTSLEALRTERSAWVEERIRLSGRSEELRAQVTIAEARYSSLEAEMGRLSELFRSSEAARATELDRERLARDRAIQEREKAERDGRERATALDASIRDAKESLIQAETALRYERERVSTLEGRLAQVEASSGAHHPGSGSGSSTVASTTTETPAEITATTTTTTADAPADTTPAKLAGKTLEEWDAQVRTLQEEVSQYRGISEGAEAALASLQSTYDHYKAEMDKRINTDQEEVRSIRETRAILERTLREVGEESRGAHTRWSEREASLIAQITTAQEEVAAHKARISELEERAREAQEARALAEERANQAAARSAAELKARASEAAEAAEVRERLRESREALATAQREAILSAERVSAAERAANESKRLAAEERREAEEEARRAREQHYRLERDYTAIRQQLSARSTALDSLMGSGLGPEASGATEGTAETASGEETLGNLRTLIDEQRGDLDRLKMEREVRLQEVRRLQGELDSSNVTISTLRQSLAAERERSMSKAEEGGQGGEGEAEGAGGITATNAALMARLSELTVLKESNDFLRTTSTAATMKVKTLEDEIRAREVRIQPLEEKLSLLQGRIQALEEERAHIMQERDRWQARAAEILQTQRRIDPAEHLALQQERDALKERVEALEAELEELKAKFAASEKLVEKYTKAVRHWNEKYLAALKELDEFKKETKTQQAGRVDPEAHRLSQERQLRLQTELNLLKKAGAEKEAEQKRIQGELESLSALKASADEEVKRMLAKVRVVETRRALAEKKTQIAEEALAALTIQHAGEGEKRKAEEVPRVEEAKKAKTVPDAAPAVQELTVTPAPVAAQTSIPSAHADLPALVDSPVIPAPAPTPVPVPTPAAEAEVEAAEVASPLPPTPSVSGIPDDEMEGEETEEGSHPTSTEYATDEGRDPLLDDLDDNEEHIEEEESYDHEEGGEEGEEYHEEEYHEEDEGEAEGEEEGGEHEEHEEHEEHGEEEEVVVAPVTPSASISETVAHPDPEETRNERASTAPLAESSASAVSPVPVTPIATAPSPAVATTTPAVATPPAVVSTPTPTSATTTPFTPAPALAPAPAPTPTVVTPPPAATPTAPPKKKKVPITWDAPSSTPTPTTPTAFSPQDNSPAAMRQRALNSQSARALSGSPSLATAIRGGRGRGTRGTRGSAFGGRGRGAGN